ncbi:MAG: hypothetical protein AAB065_08240 [Deltaproteobacteria bacterium]
MICIDNRGYEASLETRKIYEVLTDRGAEKDLVAKLVNDVNGVKSVKNRMTIE